MAITEYPETGTRVRGEWKHPYDESQWETITGTVVPFNEALTHPAPEGAGLTQEEIDVLNLFGEFDGVIAVKIETTERGVVPEEIADELSNTYANFAFEDVTILD